MPQRTTIERAAGQPPAWIENNPAESVRQTMGSTNFDLGIAVIIRSRNQHQIAIPLHHPQAILQGLILSCGPHRKTVAINQAVANPREVKTEQQRVYR